MKSFSITVWDRFYQHDGRWSKCKWKQLCVVAQVSLQVTERVRHPAAIQRLTAEGPWVLMPLCRWHCMWGTLCTRCAPVAWGADWSIANIAKIRLTSVLYFKCTEIGFKYWCNVTYLGFQGSPNVVIVVYINSIYASPQFCLNASSYAIFYLW